MRRHWWGQRWPWRGSKDRELPTFWHSNLLQEAGVLILLLLLFAASGAAALAELRRRYIAVYRAEAEKVELTLSDQLQQAREELIQFSQLPGPLRNGQTARLLTDFSELYQLNSQLRITRIIKRLPGSQVFRGFSLSRSPLVGYLQQSRSTTVFSPLLRQQHHHQVTISAHDRGPGRWPLCDRLDRHQLERWRHLQRCRARPGVQCRWRQGRRRVSRQQHHHWVTISAHDHGSG